MASAFKQQCLAILDRVAEDGVAYIVTKHGRPVARVEPIEEVPPPRPTMGSVTLLSKADEDYFSTREDWSVEAE